VIKVGGIVAGQRLGSYLVVGTVTRGRRGVVASARHDEFGDVLIEAAPWRPDQIEVRARLAEEFERRLELSSPQIARGIELFEADEKLIYVCERPEGVDLERLRRQREGGFTLGEVLSLASAIASALAEARSHGLLHLALSPARVFVDGDLRPTLVDFVLPPDTNGRTVLGRAVETAPGGVRLEDHFLAPEQWTGEELDSRTDMHALGVLVHYLLSGRFPFQARSRSGLMTARLSQDAVPLSIHKMGVPRELERLVLRLIARRPAERPADLSDAQAALSRLLEAQGRDLARVTPHASLCRPRRARPSALLESTVVDLKAEELSSESSSWRLPAVPSCQRRCASCSSPVDVEASFCLGCGGALEAPGARAATVAVLPDGAETSPVVFAGRRTDTVISGRSTAAFGEGHAERSGAPARSRAATGFPGALQERAAWNGAGVHEQDRLVGEAARRLEGRCEHVETQLYACGGLAHRVATFRHLKSGILLQLLPGGCFEMGVADVGGEFERCHRQWSFWLRERRARGDDVGRLPGNLPMSWLQHESPRRSLRLAPFLMGRFPLRQLEWDAIGGADRRTWRGEDRPIEGVSYRQAESWLEAYRGELRLPSESEWEFACRAGTNSRYFWGAEFDASYCWVSSNSDDQTHAVTEHERLRRWNAFGLIDTCGNVWEHCRCAWAERLEALPEDGSAYRPETDSGLRVGRGGGWRNGPVVTRSSFRYRSPPDRQYPYVGFRIAMDLEA
jgi:formylglycine-generating enzyme required for sulfatase activity